MTANQPPPPREWLMTDERLGDHLWAAIAALPAGSGVVFRHYSLGQDDRREIARQVGAICRERGLLLSIARDAALARDVGAAMVHNPIGDAFGFAASRSAHSAGEVQNVAAKGAALIFLSPIYPTSSHPEAEPLAPTERRRIVTDCAVHIIALGGMNRARFAEVADEGFYGWAGIDAWIDGAVTV